MPKFLLHRVLEALCSLAVIFAHRFGESVKVIKARSIFIAGLQIPSFVQDSSNANITIIFALYSFRHVFYKNRSRQVY